MTKLTRIIVLALALMMLIPSVISATVPYATYTYSIDGEVLDSPDAYVPEKIVNSVSLGLDVKLKNPSDIESDSEGNLYITDKENNRLVVLNEFYEVKYVIDGFINQHGIDDTFSGPRSTFVVNDGDFKGLYVCDTLNSRLLVFNQDNGKFIREIGKPESELFNENQKYSPVSCVVDKYGRIYVASSDTTQGVIVMTAQGDFINFIGAPKVTISAMDALIQMFSKSAGDALIFVPTVYNTLDIDESTGEFVYATIMYSSEEDKTKQEGQLTTKETDGSPVRLLNANGTDIMKRNGFFAPSGEVAIDSTKLLTGSNATAPKGPSEIADISSGPNGVWSIIDQKRSKVYTYDKDGNLLYIFGDRGSQLGNLTSAVAITYQGSNIIVLDVTVGAFTVYRRTEYANLLDEAIQLQNEREYDKAAEKWDEVLAKNNNFDTAYVEKGKAMYRKGDYKEAEQYFKNAYDVENYALTFKELRKQRMETLFLPLIAGIILLVWLISLVFKKAGKINKATATKVGPRTFAEELTFGFHLMFHPFDGFWDLKHEKRGSVRASLVFIAATVVAFIIQAQGQGYYYAPQGTTGSAFGQIFSVVIPFALVIIANWCFTTLFDGEGSLKDIFIAVSYSLFPVPVLVVISTLLTHVLVGTEGQITTMIVTVAYIWMGLLMVLGLQVTHDYSSGKNILTVIATLVGMVFIMFIAVLFTSLLTKMTTFVTTIINEISYR